MSTKAFCDKCDKECEESITFSTRKPKSEEHSYTSSVYFTTSIEFSAGYHLCANCIVEELLVHSRRDKESRD